MEKILFIDRDGVILKEPEGDRQVDSMDKFEFIPGVISGLSQIMKRGEFGKLVMVTNQDGLGTFRFPEEKFRGPHEKMAVILRGEGIRFDEILIDRSLPQENSDFRKPRTAMVSSYLEGPYDIENSLMIGDRLTDMEFARNAGCRGIWFTAQKRVSEPGPDLKDTVLLISDDWKEISRFITGQSRKVRVERKTRETDIRLILNPDGRGAADIHTGLRFLDHMLEQLACHSGLDISLSCRGDLDVDEHHTIEDCALVLGEGIWKVMGKAGEIRRYGFLLPMDDSLAKVALDLGGRPWLSWDCRFSQPRVGDVPTAMFEHFFRSFSTAARCTLHISVSGKDDHHKIESVFKAVARCLGDALERNGRSRGVPSTKGRI